MKRIIAVCITLLMAVCLLTVTVSAAPEAELSADLKTLTYDGQRYTRGDITGIYYSEFDQTDWTLRLPAELDDDVKAYRVSTACNKAIVKLSLRYQDGSSLEVGFVESQCAQELDALIHNDTLEVSTSYYWEEDGIISAPLSDFKGTACTLDRLMLDYYYDRYYVYAYCDALGCQVNRGVVLTDGEQAIYVDFQENGINSEEMEDIYEWPAVNAYEIADPALSQALIEDWKSRNDFGIDEDDYLGQVLSGIFLCFVFALIPIAIFIPSVIFALRGKGYYRITWGITAALSAATLVLFILLGVMVFLA